MTNSLGLRVQNYKMSSTKPIVLESAITIKDSIVESKSSEYFIMTLFMIFITGLGLGVSIPYSILEVNMFKKTGLETGSFFALFFIVMGIYFVVDVFYQIIFEIKFVNYYVKKYNIPIITQRFYLFGLFSFMHHFPIYIYAFYHL